MHYYHEHGQRTFLESVNVVMRLLLHELSLQKIVVQVCVCVVLNSIILFHLSCRIMPQQMSISIYHTLYWMLSERMQNFVTILQSIYFPGFLLMILFCVWNSKKSCSCFILSFNNFVHVIFITALLIFWKILFILLTY